MTRHLNTILLLLAILLLAYIAFLKPQPQRFAKTVSFDILVDTATGRLCDARTRPKEAIKRARREIKRLEALPTDTEPDWFAQNAPPPPKGFVLERPPPERKTELDKAWDHLKNLLSHHFPYCSEL